MPDLFPDPRTLSEQQARDLLLRLRPDHEWDSCPKCRGARIYHLSDARLRCPRCMYTFHAFSRRWINVGGLSARQWLLLVRGFADECTARGMAAELSVAYNTAYKALTTVRLAILAHAPDSPRYFGPDADIDIGFGPASSKPGKPSAPLPVFGIQEKKGHVTIGLVQDLQAEDLFHYHLNFRLRLSRLGRLVYTDRYRGNDALISCGDSRLPYHVITARRGRLPIEANAGFWRYATERLRKYSGITPRRFPLYLKELEFRYNHRRQNLEAMIVRMLCSFVPKPDQ